jgi:hypothetical protein
MMEYGVYSGITYLQENKPFRGRSMVRSLCSQSSDPELPSLDMRHGRDDGQFRTVGPLNLICGVSDPKGAMDQQQRGVRVLDYHNQDH